MLRPHAFGPQEEEGARAASAADELMRSLQDELFPSNAFRAWLALVSRLLPLRCAAEARRFRRGLDYTLAGAEGAEPRLDVVLGLTPEMAPEEELGNGREGRGRKASGIGGHAHPVASGRNGHANGNGSGNGNGHASGSGSNGNGHASGSGLNGHLKSAGHKKRRSSKWATGEWGGWEVSPFPPVLFLFLRTSSFFQFASSELT